MEGLREITESLDKGSQSPARIHTSHFLNRSQIYGHSLKFLYIKEIIVSPACVWILSMKFICKMITKLSLVLAS
jgi:hypothetical protein